MDSNSGGTEAAVAERSTGSGRFVKNVLWNWTGIAISLFSAFILTPYMIRKVGPAAFGVWGLAFTLMEYYALVDFGFRSATVKYTAHYHALNQIENWNEVISTGLLYYSIVATAVMAFTIAALPLADRVFHSTQYVRHPSEPLYTPEPDIIHEVIGHGNMLASPRFAEVKRLAGEAARRVETDEALQIIADVFWFTLEFGVIREGSDLKAYGAGILSSYGEIEEFRHTEIRPIDLAEMSTIEYDITKYQPILYAAESMDHLEDVIGGFFATADDDTPARLAGGLATA